MTTDNQLLDEARKRALHIVHHCVTPHGYRASALAAGYPQVWARDAVATFLGACVTGDPELIADFSILPLGVRRVPATGTTAAGIHALVLA